MKKMLMQTFMAVLLFAGISAFGNVEAQECEEFFYEPYDECAPACVSAYDWEDCCWEPCVDSPNRFYVGPVYYFRRTDYSVGGCNTQNVFGGEIDRSRGHFIGVNFGYEYRELCSFYTRIDATWSTGTGKPCPHTRINDWQAEARIGYTWGECVPAGYGVSPYVGVGYLTQDRKYGRIGYSATYDTWFVPIGIYADVEITYGFTAGIDFAFAPFFATNVDTFHQDFDLGKHDNKNRYMWRVSIPLRYQIMCDAGFEISVEPFWEQLHFGGVCSQFDETGLILQIPGVPGFREDFWGAKFLAAYKF